MPLSNTKDMTLTLDYKGPNGRTGHLHIFYTNAFHIVFTFYPAAGSEIARYSELEIKKEIAEVNEMVKIRDSFSEQMQKNVNFEIKRYIDFSNDYYAPKDPLHKVFAHLAENSDTEYPHQHLQVSSNLKDYQADNQLYPIMRAVELILDDTHNKWLHEFILPESIAKLRENYNNYFLNLSPRTSQQAAEFREEKIYAAEEIRKTRGLETRHIKSSNIEIKEIKKNEKTHSFDSLQNLSEEDKLRAAEVLFEKMKKDFDLASKGPKNKLSKETITEPTIASPIITLAEQSSAKVTPLIPSSSHFSDLQRLVEERRKHGYFSNAKPKSSAQLNTAEISSSLLVNTETTISQKRKPEGSPSTSPVVEQTLTSTFNLFGQKPVLSGKEKSSELAPPSSPGERKSSSFSLSPQSSG